MKMIGKDNRIESRTSNRKNNRRQNVNKWLNFACIWKVQLVRINY